MKTILLLLCLPACALAMEFRLLSWQGDITGLRYDEAGKPVEVIASEHSLSETYRKADASAPLEFYREVEVGGKPVRQVLARIAPPEAPLARALLVLAPVAGGYTGRWLDDSIDSHPANTLRLYNFSSRALAVQTGGEQWRQEPGQSRRVAFDPAARQVVIRIAAQVGAGWELVAGGPQPVRKNSRVYLLVRDFRPDGNEARSTDRVDLILLHDRLRPPQVARLGLPPVPPAAPVEPL